MNTEHLIKNAIKHYDNQVLQYDKFINSSNVKIINNNKIIFNDINYEGEIELLGLFINDNNLWLWSWITNENYYNILLSRQLLEYGLKIELDKTIGLDEKKLIKNILVNSRININSAIMLDVNIAIISYLLKDKIKFIYYENKYLNKERTKYITNYYLVKNIISN